MVRQDDPMLKDGKKLALDEPLVMVYFALSVLVALPIALCVLLPMTLVAQVVLKIMSIVQGNKGSTSGSLQAAVGEPFTEFKEGGPKLKRQFDIVVYGATGFTGKMAALYLAKQYGCKVKWAIAGRRRGALEEIRAELAVIDSSLADLPIVLADSSDLKSLHDLVISTKVVITTAGLYSVNYVHLAADVY